MRVANVVMLQVEGVFIVYVRWTNCDSIKFINVLVVDSRRDIHNSSSNMLLSNPNKPKQRRYPPPQSSHSPRRMV